MDETSTVADSAALAPSAGAPPRTGAPPRGSVFGADLVGEGSWVSLLVWAVLFAGPLAVLITAATLTPSIAGHGTHTQLGLPPCGFLVYTGYPCPGCGLTTSFSHMIRLEVFGAFHANPFGILLFLCTAAMVPVSLLGMVRKLPVVDTLDRLHAEKIAIALSLVSIAVWCVKVGIQYAAS
ncbi:MAG: DUF2752 domain-containing protein [Sandaracinaceae bacterium]|nr:MAG: DUF2752 domain-containing protein [Sandaracinaceae bacterium]